MKNRIVLTVLTLVLSATTIAQTNVSENYQTESKRATKFDFRRDIQLENSKKSEEISITIPEKAKEFKLQIESAVSYGKLDVEIYDANGKKQGVFSVGTQLGLENSEHAQGTINKSLLEPDAGEWKVKIIPQDANGIIIIHTATWL